MTIKNLQTAASGLASPTPAPQTSDQTPPAAASIEGGAPPIGNAPDANPNPPSSPEAAVKTGKKTFCVWVQPGHDALGVGQIFTTPPAKAEMLRGAGRARFASEAEIKAAKKGDVAVDHFESV
ncbi:MAG TPA: hypothetical protein DGP25_04050 [Brevundimonas sp.]|nr:hypothetical protein [Brevundimonas sp.]